MSSVDSREEKPGDLDGEETEGSGTSGRRGRSGGGGRSFRDVRAPGRPGGGAGAEEGAGASGMSGRGGGTPQIVRPLSKMVTRPPSNLESQKGRHHGLRQGSQNLGGGGMLTNRPGTSRDFPELPGTSRNWTVWRGVLLKNGDRRGGPIS